MKNNTENGFTLVEMLVVLFIIGIIIAIALPNFIQASKKANIHADKANRRMISMQVENYYLDKGKYPNSIQVLVTEKYLRAVPDCPGDAGKYKLIHKSGEIQVICQ
ncbi:competence type IV pilus major pilin ComGC [Shimazuella kribbensis]|uniref:competence type IV pilus major pilin ComGC n=1 Tax=Shimazuella kribbensis TaxID=139808 RepID=UPI00041F6568|nr:prepilin-type N-terminal cleavage/methylation domain-containing protein [Shimazuella kribbensis]